MLGAACPNFVLEQKLEQSLNARSISEFSVSAWVCLSDNGVTMEQGFSSMLNVGRSMSEFCT
jgi:hypothetical protein